MTAPQSFDDLLDVDSAGAIRTPTRPGGTSLCTVATAEQVKSSKKGTPGLEYTFTDFDPQGDVDPDRWDEYTRSPVVDMTSDNMTTTFWLTPKSRFMLKEFCIKCGVSPDGKTLRQMADEVLGEKVMVIVKQSVGARSVFANIEEFAASKE